MTVEASSSKCAHPPRSNRPRSSSSGPPGPCITPSMETCVVVVSFMVAVPFSLGLGVVRFDRPAAPILSVPAEPVRPIHSAPSPNTARVGDVVRLNAHREHGQALFRVRAAAAEGLQRRLRPPALEDVDTAGVDQVRTDRDVEAANCPASLFDDAHTACEVGVALLRLNGDVSCNDDHGCAPVLSPSCPARRAVPLSRTACHPFSTGSAMLWFREFSLPPNGAGGAGWESRSAALCANIIENNFPAETTDLEGEEETDPVSNMTTLAPR